MRNPVSIGYLVSSLCLLLVVFGVSATSPASARGAAANIMNSPGYQRALEESRKRYRDSVHEPASRSPSGKPRKTSRHRGQHR